MSLDNVKNVVLVLSGKGGVGKSSITTQLALSLSLQGHAVGILDVDLTGPSIPRLLGIESSKIRQAPGGWLPVKVHPGQLLQPPPPFTYSSVDSGEPGDGERPSDVDATAGKGETVEAPSATADGKSSSHPPAEAVSVPAELADAVNIGPLYAISLAFLLASRSSAVVWRGPKKTAMVRQFLSDVLWPPLDYLLIDTPPGTSDEHISLVETLLTKVKSVGAPSSAHPSANGTDAHGTTTTPVARSAPPTNQPNLAGAVIVTTPQAVAISDVRKEISFCAKTKVPVIGVIENMSGFVCPCCGVPTSIFSKGGGQIMAAEYGLDFLGRVPIDGLWGELVEEGIRPIYGLESMKKDAKGEEEEKKGEEEKKKGAGEEVERNGAMEAEHIGADNGNENNEDKNEEMDDEAGSEGDSDDEDDNLPIFPLFRHERDPALLVDKYRNCSLAPGFASITRAVVDVVAQGRAVQVGGSTAAATAAAATRS